MTEITIPDQFAKDCAAILSDLSQILRRISETHLDDVKLFADYGQKVDRLMGGARNLSANLGENHPLVRLGECAELCKVISYQVAARPTKNPTLAQMTLAFLEDATEFLILCNRLILQKSVAVPTRDLKILERFRWFIETFGPEILKPQKSDILKQDDIDDMMKKWGLG